MNNRVALKDVITSLPNCQFTRSGLPPAAAYLFRKKAPPASVVTSVMLDKLSQVCVMDKMYMISSDWDKNVVMVRLPALGSSPVVVD